MNVFESPPVTWARNCLLSSVGVEIRWASDVLSPNGAMKLYVNGSRYREFRIGSRKTLRISGHAIDGVRGHAVELPLIAIPFGLKPVVGLETGNVDSPVARATEPLHTDIAGAEASRPLLYEDFPLVLVIGPENFPRREPRAVLDALRGDGNGWVGGRQISYLNRLRR